MLPNCPKCNSEYTYEDGSLLVCPECAYEWSQEASNEEENVIKDVNGNVLNATGNLRMSYVIAAIASIVVVIIVLFINEHQYNRDFMTECEAEAFTKELQK